jgi:hypothetical protein
MDPDNDLAQGSSPYVGYIGIGDPNLYFFSWGAFVMSFFVLFGYLKKGAKLTGTQIYSWAGLCLTSFVVMVSGIRQFDDLNCDKDQPSDELDNVCKRTKLAVSVGLISAVVGAAWALLGRFMDKCGKLTKITDLLVTWIVFVLWIFAVIYVCFGSDKAAKVIGNLYFFTWGSFALSVAMAMKSLKMMLGGEEDNEDGETHIEAHKEDPPKHEVPQEEDSPVIEPNVPVVPEDEEAHA